LEIRIIAYILLPATYRMTSSHHEANHDEESGLKVERLQTCDMEIGITDAVQKHIRSRVPPSIFQRRLDFARWLRELAVEAFGVFLFV
jgi:hypothetical protein